MQRIVSQVSAIGHPKSVLLTIILQDRYNTHSFHKGVVKISYGYIKCFVGIIF